MANPFDQFDAAPAHPAGNNPFDQFDSHPSAPITRAPGATGFGAVAQTFSDLFNPHAGQEHDPNAIEQAILPVANSRPIQSLKANFDQAVDSGLFMEPTRAVMEGLGVGRQPNETNQAFHARYNRAITSARADAQQRAQANTVGAYDGNPLHMTARAAQQVGNVGAGIVANPQYFALPGMGIGNSVAARVGTSAALNAGVGAASDDAAQLMDIAAGQKKDFDIQQNLANTVMGGAAGAALHGAVEVAPFIKSLFADRGRDTTPGAYPLGQTSPITPNQVVMNPAESAQYRQLLASGSVDDIKNFFKGRQGPQPSWQDVNNWVDHRDAAQQSDTVPQHVQDTVQRLLPTDQATHVQNVTNHVNTITAGWKNAPEIEVVHSPADIADPGIRAQVTAQDPTGDSVGIYGSDGKVRLFSQNIHTPDQASAALFHEGLGHYGLDQQFGDRLNQVMTTLADRNVGQFGKAVDAYQQANPGTSRALAAEETLAEASQKGTMKPSWQQAVGTAVKQFGRKIGLNLKYSDGEINHILAMSHDAVVNGKSVRDNGFRGGNKYMFMGPKASGFDPHSQSAYLAKDGVVRNEISDIDSHYRGVGTTLGEVLEHPKLYERYPELEHMPVKFKEMPGYAGMYSAGDATNPPHIRINPYEGGQHQTILHEIQHAIQDIEDYPDFVRAKELGGTITPEHEGRQAYLDHPSEQEARATEERFGLSSWNRNAVPPKFMRTDALGREHTNPENLNELDRLKADPRYWSDPEYRANVNEMARTQFPAEHGTNKFMKADQFAKLDPEEQEKWRNVGIRDADSAIRIREEDLNALEKFVDDHPELVGGPPQRLADHPDLSARLGVPMFFRVLAEGPAELSKFFHMFTGDLQAWHQQRQALIDAKTPEELHAELPIWIHNRIDEENGGGYNPKFATRAQIASTGIARKDFVPADLEGMATHITMNYDREANEQPIAITRELAFRAGIEPNDIKLLAAQHPGELAARVARIGAAADLASTRIKDILTKFDTPEWTSQHHFDLASAIADRNYLVERFKEESGAIGRALNVTKIFRSMTNGNIAAVMERLREEGSGLASLADPTNPEGLKFARQLKQAIQANPGKAQNLMTNVNKPYWEQYLTTFHMNMMLSALSTHFKAPIDMGTGIARNVIEKVVAMPIGKVRQMFEAMTGKTVQPGVEVAELSNHLQGMMDAVTTAEVYRQSLVALRTGQSSYVLADKGGIGAASPQVVPTNFANQFGAISNPRFTGAAGVLNKPMDAVSAQDTFFRSVEMNAQLGTLGAREAREELGPGASTRDVMARGRYWAQNPTPTMLRDAFEETNRTLLLNDNPINRIINRARLYRPGMNVGQRAMAWFANNLAPFIRVESNSLINRVIQRSPLAILDPTGYTQAQLKAGGAKADIALSKMIYGTFLMGMMWTAAAKGKDYLTGQGDSNVQRYKEDIAAGRVPNAVHENGRFTTGGQLGMSINPFDMHNKTAQMVASMRQAWDAGANQGQVGTGFMLAAGALFHDLAESSWVSDLTPAMDAITAHGEQGSNVVSNFVANEAKTFVPNLSNQIARKTDVQRDTTVDGSQAQKVFGHISNELESTVPGLRENLPVKYSVYGNPLPTGASMTGVHTMIPGLSGNGTTETTDPAERELDRLNVILPDLKAPTGEPDLPKTLVTGVSRSIKIDGQKRQLNPAEFEEYQHRAGRHIVEDVRQEMSTPEWQNMSDYDRVLTVRQIESDQKVNAKEELFGQ